jgi:hypothetical protein
MGRISVEAGQYSGETQAEGYVRITVPLHNVGAGLALVHTARLMGFQVGWTIPWRSSVQTAAPPGQLARVSFGADIDAGDGQVLGIELEGDELISFAVEVGYSDLSGEQETRTLLKIQGRRLHWRVTDVELYQGESNKPFVVLHREAQVVAAPQ